MSDKSQTCSCCERPTTQTHQICPYCLKLARAETRVPQQGSSPHCGTRQYAADVKRKNTDMDRMTCLSCGVLIRFPPGRQEVSCPVCYETYTKVYQRVRGEKRPAINSASQPRKIQKADHQLQAAEFVADQSRLPRDNTDSKKASASLVKQPKQPVTLEQQRNRSRCRDCRSLLRLSKSDELEPCRECSLGKGTTSSAKCPEDSAKFDPSPSQDNDIPLEGGDDNCQSLFQLYGSDCLLDLTLLPKNWTNFNDLQYVTYGYLNVQLDDTSKEFHLVKTILGENPAFRGNKKMFRLQNKRIWIRFAQKRQKMVADMGEPLLTEMWMLHGSVPSSTRRISWEGLDHRKDRGAKTNNQFGNGLVVTKGQFYDQNFNKTNRVFVCRVLAGLSGLGAAGYNHPPYNTTGRMFNSCVDNLASPTAHVIFDNDQVYPAYLVELSN